MTHLARIDHSAFGGRLIVLWNAHLILHPGERCLRPWRCGGHDDLGGLKARNS